MPKTKSKAQRNAKRLRSEPWLSLNNSIISGMMPELKYQDVSISSTISSAVTVHYPGPSLGTGASERVGRSIRVLGVHFRFTLLAADASNVIRICSGVSRNGSIPTLISAASNPFGELTLDKPIRWITDETVPLEVQGSNSTYKDVVVDRYIPFNTDLVYDSSNVSISNLPFVMVCSDSVAIAHPSCYGSMRFYYKDV